MADKKREFFETKQMHKVLLVFKWVVSVILIMVALTVHISVKISERPKNYRFLLCVSSFKRPIFLSGQLWRMMNQTYQNFDISVSVKGIDKDWADKTFMQEWQPFVETGRVILRFDSNRKQMNNFLDTVRDIDLTQYDYFCKIDDDDWYTPDYLEDVNKNINSQKNVTVTGSRNAYILTENIDSVVFRKNNTGLMGPTLCFSRKVIETALEIEKNPSLLKVYLPNDGEEWMFNSREDRILHHLGRSLGTEVHRGGENPKVIFGWQYRSTTRNDSYVRY